MLQPLPTAAASLCQPGCPSMPCAAAYTRKLCNSMYLQLLHALKRTPVRNHPLPVHLLLIARRLHYGDTDVSEVSSLIRHCPASMLAALA
jgi:hypothetical protein